MTQYSRHGIIIYLNLYLGGWMVAVVNDNYAPVWESDMRRMEEDGKWRCISVQHNLYYEFGQTASLFHIQTI